MENLSSIPFSFLTGMISEFTLKAISEMGFEKLTKIQVGTLPHVLDGRDMVASAKTGSGKTLAFLIPTVELMYKLKFTPKNGTCVLVISPTRELSMQTYGVVKEILKYHSQSHGLIMGGANRQTEVEKLSAGANILIATPGRLLDHLQNTPKFLFKNLRYLIIDEADLILDNGFEQQMKQIIEILPKTRQTLLFSATLSEETKSLISVALNNEPIYVGVDEKEETATVEGLQQGYIVCPSDKRFLLLFRFLKKYRKKKVMVFFSSCMSVKFHNELLNALKKDLPVSSIHGKQKQTKRTRTFSDFCSAKSGILLCTDVAARGLDIPKVDRIIQYDPPHDPKEYIHRVGRTARGVDGSGHALLILLPQELKFVWYLKNARVPVVEYDCNWNKIPDFQNQLEELVTENYDLRMSAIKAFKDYLRAYRAHMKKIYNIKTLDHTAVAKSFGLTVVPLFTV